MVRGQRGVGVTLLGMVVVPPAGGPGQATRPHKLGCFLRFGRGCWLFWMAEAAGTATTTTRSTSSEPRTTPEEPTTTEPRTTPEEPTATKKQLPTHLLTAIRGFDNAFVFG